jgi:folate-binding protein YgfZ
MNALALHEFHQGLNARFTAVNGREAVLDYGDAPAEYAARHASAAVMDLSFRARLCVTGADRQRFLHGQATNNVKDLGAGEGCYAAFVNAKGRMQSDANIFCLRDEFLLDCEPGYGVVLAGRFEHYIIADDVQVSDVEALYGLLSVQGPRAAEVVAALGLGAVPAKLLSFLSYQDGTLGEIYCMNQPRGQTLGFDLFVPAPALAAVADKLIAAARAVGGRACGWSALETARIEAGIPRFGADMDETNLPPEAGIEGRAVSYTKGCYVGQEVIARIRTYGQVAKTLRGLRLADDLPSLPQRGDKLFHGDTEVGCVTSAVASPLARANIALGYVRREHNTPGTELQVRAAAGASAARVVELPFTGQAHQAQ